MRRLLAICCTALLLSLFAGNAAFADLTDFQQEINAAQKGQDAFNKRDYATALREFEPLAKQGNSIAQTGVAAGIAIGVLEPDMVNFAGVAPIMIYLAESGEIFSISGLGTWPRAANCQYFHDKYGGAIPEGVDRTVIPSAPDAWITALEHYGTMSFAEVAAAAIRFVKEGFPVYPLMTEVLDAAAPTLREWPSRRRDSPAPAFRRRSNRTVSLRGNSTSSEASVQKPVMRLADLATGSNGGRNALGMPVRYAPFSPILTMAFCKVLPIRAGWPTHSVGEAARMQASAIPIRKVQTR